MDPIYISGSRSWGMRGFLLAFLGRPSEWLGARCGLRMGFHRSSSFYVDFFSITTILYFTCYTEYVHIKD